MKLYLVSDRSWLQDSTLAKDVEKAIKGGVTFVQIREKNLDEEAFIQEAKTLKSLCHEAGIPFVVNDDVRVARAVDADGIHVGQHDMPACEVRALLGEDKIVGVSAQSVEAAIKAERDGADYLGVGAVFSTNTKKDADDVSFETLQAITAAVTIPVIAIGGITYENMQELKGSGINGVALVSAIMASEDITKSTKRLREKCEELFG